MTNMVLHDSRDVVGGTLAEEDRFKDFYARQFKNASPSLELATAHSDKFLELVRLCYRVRQKERGLCGGY